MAATTPNINFFAATNPDLYQRQLDLQQQQELANAMMGQSLTPMNPTQSSGRYIVPISKFQGLSKIGEALATAMMKKNLNAEQADLAKQQAASLGSLFGNNVAPASSPAVQGALSAGAAVGDVGPTNTNAQRLATNLQAQGVPANNSFTLPGMSPQQAQMSFMLDPSSYMGTYMKQFAPTEAQQNTAAAYGPGTQQSVQALQNIVQQQGGMGPMNVRPGGTVYSPANGQPLFTAPQNGVQTQWGPQGPQAVAVPNAQELAARGAGMTTGAEAAAKFPYQEVTTGSGARVPAFAAGFTPPQAPGLRPAPQPGVQPAQSPIQPGPQATPSVGQSTLSHERSIGVAKSSDEYVNQLREGASGAVTQNRLLNELEDNLQQITPGKLAAVRKTIAQWKVASGFGNDNDRNIAASSEASDKITGQLVSSALKSMTARPTQAEFVTFLNKFVPSMEMTPQGSQQIIQFMRQSNNMNAQKFDEFQTWKRAQPSDTDYRDFDVYWNRKLAASPLQAGSSFGVQNLIDQSHGQVPAQSRMTTQQAQPRVIDFSQLK